MVPYPSDRRLPSMRAARDHASDSRLPSIRAARDDANDRPYLRALARSTHGPSPTFAAAVQRYGYAGGPSTSVQRQPDSAPFVPGIRLRRHKPGTGHRTARVKDMTENDLYLTDERPPVAGKMHAHHECSIYSNIKSHPVVGACGHTYCYVCLHLWLQRKWRCPYCRAVYTAPPVRNRDSKNSIAFDHPEWIDRSTVNYSWEGLTFPKPADLSRLRR
ncbi:hypothetical protein B0H16DRAFT_1716035 [Mycena metata]|uniref:RING-type domain-containing protein n=1 Tax=Mycena metata TaxID=1033252 RepID=A0AAD7JSV6_9AGAR|nr:hypothetical protein B0H16DRAFT_1716035 [Mycena metata]